MKKNALSGQTPATQWLTAQGLPFVLHRYDYIAHGGALHAAHSLGLDLHHVAKTLIMEDELARPMAVIMHGDRDVSLKNLARQTHAKRIAPCKPATAERHSGYQVGGTSPFGLRKPMPVWVEEGLLFLPEIHINAGRRGLLATVAPRILVDVLGAGTVQVAI